MLGGLYQSVLRNELTHRLGVEWGPIVKGQSEIAGAPTDLLGVFSKRSAEIDEAMKARVADFRQRHGRAPSRFERAAMEREASADTRGRKSGLGAAELATRWLAEAAEVGWTPQRLVHEVEVAARDRAPTMSLSDRRGRRGGVGTAFDWGRPEVVQAICDLHRPVSQMSGHRWAQAIERGADRVLERCVDLDPPDVTRRRDVRSPIVVDRTDRTPLHVRSSPRRGGARHHLGDRGSARATCAVDDRGSRRPRRAPGSDGSGGGRR